MSPVRSGGSIPIVPELAKEGAPVVLSGIGLPDDPYKTIVGSDGGLYGYWMNNPGFWWAVEPINFDAPARMVHLLQAI